MSTASLQFTAKSLLKLTLVTAATVAVNFATPEVARGAVLSFEARGLDSGLNSAFERNNFFGVTFNSAPVGTFVESVTFDLSPDSNAFFDITPGFLSPGSFGFDFEVGSASGLSVSEITRSVSPDNKKLTLTFAGGAFSVGDSFRFGIDTDRVGSSFLGLDLFDPGVDFGLAGTLVSAVLSNGTSGATTFEPVSFIFPSQSVAVLDIDDPEVVAEPTSVVGLLALAAVGASSTFARKKKGNFR